jgi:hypothetical protein
LARPVRAVRLAALFIILIAAIYVVLSSRFIRNLGRAGVHDVAEVLEGEVTEGPVSVRGIVDLVEPEDNVVFLKDLKKQEVCIDSVCLFAVIKVYTETRFEEGQEAVVTGQIEHEDGLPVVVSPQDAP